MSGETWVQSPAEATAAAVEALDCLGEMMDAGDWALTVVVADEHGTLRRVHVREVASALADKLDEFHGHLEDFANAFSK